MISGCWPDSIGAILLSEGELGLHPKPSRSYGTSGPAGRVS